MSRPYLVDYFKDSDLIDKNKLDLLKYELDQRIYYYGGHFKRSKENEIICSQTLKWNFKYFLKYLYTFFSIFKNNKKENRKIVISNAYFSINESLLNSGLNVLRPMHDLVIGQKTVGNFKIVREFIKIDNKIRSSSFSDLLSNKFLKELDIFEADLTKYYKSIDAAALIVPSDISFFEQLNIRIFRKLGRPSFIFSHGLPGRYNVYDDNQTDYLVVWGAGIKQNYIKVGFSPDKILVSGHPFYSQLSNPQLRNSFKNILIVSKSLHGAQQRDEVRLADRGNLIFYLNKIADELKKLGVKKVRLRVHPSENIDWYFRFIDKDFFIEDNRPLQKSLEESTLVIGPTSTILLESIYYGVNYIVYEPIFNGVDLSGYPLVNPFDGSDYRVPVAKSEKELEQLLINRKTIDKTVFHDYIQTPFNIQKIIDLI